MDATLIAGECIDSRMKGGTPGIMCELDIQKVYDHVTCTFLLDTLKQMRSGSKWVKRIELCIKTVRISILVNGELVGFLTSARG